MNTTNDITNALGIRKVLETVSSDLEVIDDIEGEQESCGVYNEHNSNTQMDPNAPDDDEEVLANISEASRGVKEGTDAAYKRSTDILSSWHLYHSNMTTLTQDHVSV